MQQATCKAGDVIRIDREVTVTVLAVVDNEVIIGIDAPGDYAVGGGKREALRDVTLIPYEAV